MSKKSYMDKSNLLREGFFNKLITLIKQSKVKKDPVIKNNIKKMNDLVSDIEKSLNKRRKDRGLDAVDLPRYNVKDLFK